MAKDTQERILDAAREHFLRDGFRRTSLDQVAESAGVTKPTVYAHFKSKTGLLMAVTAAQAKSNADTMMMSLEPTGDIESDLLRFGRVFLNAVLSEQSICWHRLSIAESHDHPEVGDAVFASGPARVIKALTDFLDAETSAGRLKCGNANIAAEQFIGLLSGLNPIRVMTGQPIPSKAKLHQICDQAVQTFLSAFATENS